MSGFAAALAGGLKGFGEGLAEQAKAEREDFLADKKIKALYEQRMSDREFALRRDQSNQDHQTQLAADNRAYKTDVLEDTQQHDKDLLGAKLTAEANKPGYRQITGQEAASFGLKPDVVYNLSPDGKATPVSTGGGISIDLSGLPGMGDKTDSGSALDTVSEQTPLGQGPANYESAVGAGGVLRGTANSVADAVGATVPFPETAQAGRTLERLATLTQVALVDSVSGRPSNYLLERMDKLTVRPGELTTGPESAFGKLRDTRALIQQGIDENRAILENPEAHTKSAISAAASGLQKLSALSGQYDSVIAGFGQSDSPKLPDVMKDASTGEEYKIAPTEEIAENRETGEIMIFRNGAWVLVK